MTKLNVPEILEIPPKLYPVVTELNNYRYVLLEGGRGGGKSHAIGRFILYLGEKYNLRIVCGREIQKSINESVYSLMSDLINTHNLNYEVYSSKIKHRVKETEINFRGFREQGAFNIQGMEGVDILWIDESQAITKGTLDILIPTIRKENAQIFFTMNRHVVDDPVFEMFQDRDDCLHININYDENPFCPIALKKEASECRKKSESDYDHIWMGVPLDKSEDAVYSNTDLERARSIVFSLRPGYGRRVAGFDIARYGDDKCACVILQQMGALHWEEIFSDEWEKRDLNYTTGRILEIARENVIKQSIIDENGLGAGPLDTLTHGRQLDTFKGFMNPNTSYKDDKYYCNPRTLNAFKLKDLLMKGHIKLNNPDLIKELLTIKYEFDNYQRRRLVSKEKMRKEGVKSPNLADSLIMAVSLMDDVRQEDETKYTPEPQYYAEENLFDQAGIK